MKVNTANDDLNVNPKKTIPSAQLRHKINNDSLKTVSPFVRTTNLHNPSTRILWIMFIAVCMNTLYEKLEQVIGMLIK
jgi:hypothetical protein